MKTVEQIAAEVNELVKLGGELLLDRKDALTKLRFEYESWYTKSLGFIQQIVPERVADFRNAYKLEKRDSINPETYTIHDYLRGLSIHTGDRPGINHYLAYQHQMSAQVAILKAAGEAAVSLLRDVRTVLRAELFDNDLGAARELLNAGHLRSAGVISGVVLEGHLKSVAARRSITFAKKKPVISDLNDGLKGAGVYDVPTWRFIQRLGDIRNLCGHADDRDPTATEVDELIGGTDKIIKSVF
jgi:hypothetical protein